MVVQNNLDIDIETEKLKFILKNERTRLRKAKLNNLRMKYIAENLVVTQKSTSIKTTEQCFFY